eukprot:43733-Alexandrium_andersonii.AAC.1
MSASLVGSEMCIRDRRAPYAVCGVLGALVAGVRSLVCVARWARAYGSHSARRRSLSRRGGRERQRVATAVQ